MPATREDPAAPAHFRIDLFTAFVVLLGLGLVIAALFGEVGWESVALELGAGLFLVAFLHYVERRIEDRSTKAQMELSAEVTEQVEEVRQEVAQQVEEIRAAASAGARAFFEQRDARHDEMFTAFREDPSIATLVPIVERLDELHLSPVFQVRLTDNTELNFLPQLGDKRQKRPQAQVTVTVLDTATSQDRGPAKRQWTEDMDYDEVMGQLGNDLAAIHCYPGDEVFGQLDLADIVATEYRRLIDGAFNPDETAT